MKTGEQFAIKEVNISILEDKGNADALRREIEDMRSLEHPNLIKLHYVMQCSRECVSPGMSFPKGR
jgi:hypothetical protein